MNTDRIYEYRFRGVDPAARKKAWGEIAMFLYKHLNSPQSVLDPAAGFCEFINAFPAREKWAVDLNGKFMDSYANDDVKKIADNCLDADLPENYFDTVFVSNFLEHLKDCNEIEIFLKKMYDVLKKEGKIAIIGPNFKYSYRKYYDFADHKVALTELSVMEMLYSVGFLIIRIYPKFLPLSFRSGLPLNKYIVKLYLHVPLFWKIFGKQFLIIGEK